MWRVRKLVSLGTGNVKVLSEGRPWYVKLAALVSVSAATLILTILSACEVFVDLFSALIHIWSLNWLARPFRDCQHYIDNSLDHFHVVSNSNGSLHVASGLPGSA
jgi:hypothetical protein